MRIERVMSAAEVHRAADLFDAPPLPAATERFLADPNHHLLLAYDDEGQPVGMISGVETTHPDKGTEMFVYELGVAPVARLRGVGAALVTALADLARRNGCYGMWVATETDNDAARATYRRAGAIEETLFRLLNWDFLASGNEPAEPFLLSADDAGGSIRGPAEDAGGSIRGSTDDAGEPLLDSADDAGGLLSGSVDDVGRSVRESAGGAGEVAQAGAGDRPGRSDAGQT